MKINDQRKKENKVSSEIQSGQPTLDNKTGASIHCTIKLT